MSEILPLATAKSHLSEIVNRVHDQHERVTVTRNGRPAAVLISPDDLESLEETLQVLSNPDLLKKIKQGKRAAGRGDAVTLEELKARYSAR